MRSLLAALVALACFAPLAAAGSDADPEVLDAEGDQALRQVPASTTLDILAAWLHDETPETIKASLKLKSLENAAGYYEFAWAQQSRLPGGEFTLLPGGVGAHLSPQGNKFYLLKDSKTCRAAEPDAEGEAATGQIRGTSLEWTLPLAKVPLGAILTGFCARTLLEAAPPGGDRRIDTAIGGREDNGEFRSYQIGAPRMLTFAKVQLGSAEPLLTDPEESVRDGPYDLTGLWYEFLERNVNITYRLRSFSIAELGACAWSADGHFSDSDYEHSLNVYLSLSARNKTLSRVLLPDFGGFAAKAKVVIQEGTPGYVQFSYPRSAWGNDTAIVEHSIYASVDHCQQSSDAISYYNDSFWSPGLAWLGAVAALAAAARLRRR